MSNITRKLRKLFIGGRWHIAYRKIGENGSFTVFSNPKGEFCADPIPFTYKGRKYVFCEQFKENIKKGCIGYFEITDDIPVNMGIILERPYHLSYPFVFEYKGRVYMIPETSENKTVELYEAVNFPTQWKFVRKLLSGHDYVDTTVWVDADAAHFVTYHTDEGKFLLEKYDLDTDLQTAELKDIIEYKENTGRGAGAFFKKDGYIIRPSQNCKYRYGQGMFFNRVNVADKYIEKQTGELTLSDVNVKGLKHIIGVHTYAVLNNWEIVDVFAERIDCTYNIGCIIARKVRAGKLAKR